VTGAKKLDEAIDLISLRVVSFGIRSILLIYINQDKEDREIRFLHLRLIVMFCSKENKVLGKM